MTYNYSYFPFVADSEEQLLALIKYLNKEDIFPRRYFYPSLNNLPHNVGESCPISEAISKETICLPLFYELTDQEVSKIVINIIEFYR